ncbi:MAG: DMT family transporter [Myxococcales bacterium]|nr:DMT family transporter [Myxococcales bacterium]
MGSESTSDAPSKRLAALKTHLALLAVQLAFGSQAVEAKVVMSPRSQGGEGLDPAALAMARMLGGAVVFQIVHAIVRARAKPAPTPADAVDRGFRLHLRLVGLSFLGVAANQALFLAGLRLTTPFGVALLGAAIPVVTAALAVLFRVEPLRATTAVGLALALSGVLVITGVGSVDKGALLVAVNCVAYSAYIVFSRNTIRGLGAVAFMAWVFTYGAILFAPLGAAPLARALPAMSTRGLLYVAYILAVPTVAAYLLNAWALGRSGPVLVTVYIYTQPVITALIAYVQLGQGVTWRTLGAGALILAGVAVVSSRHFGGPAARRG